MRLFPPPLEIGDTEGFTPEKDIFGRADLGAGLTSLVSSVSDPTVIAVDGQWGSGKTTFLKMWAGHLRKAGFPVVYFDAFENDYVEDAFLAIASEIIALAQEKNKAKTSKGKRLVQSAVGAGKVLLRSSLRLSVKAATLGVIGSEDFEEAAKDVASEASALVDKHLGERLTKQKEEKNALQRFRDALSELPALLSDSYEVENVTKPKPLIFIIDELDRCRPTFALEILERIKHFFSVPHVHFVLGVHHAQLRNAVAIAYGPNIHAQTYLQKFIHITVPLTDRPRHWHEWPAIRYLSYLEKVMGLEDEDITDIISHVAEHRNISLRTLERIYTSLAIARAFGSKSYPQPILDGLCILKIVDPELYYAAKRNELRYPEASKALCLDRQWRRQASNVDWITEWWKFCTDATLEVSKLEEMARGIGGHSRTSERLEIPARIANEVIDRFSPKS